MNKAIDIVIEAPYGKLCVSKSDVSGHAYMRAQQLAELLALMEPADGADTVLWMAQQLANEVVASIRGMIGVKP